MDADKMNLELAQDAPRRSMQRLIRCPICDGKGRLLRRYGSDKCRHCDNGAGDWWERNPEWDYLHKKPAYTNSVTGMTVWSSGKFYLPNIQSTDGESRSQ